MKTEERLRQLFESRLAEAASGSFYGEVLAVDETSRTCTVDVQGGQYEGVLLYAVENADLRGGVRFPAVGSMVLVARIDGSERLYVAMVSEVDKVVFTLGDDMQTECSDAGISVQVGDTSLRIDGDGIALGRGTSGLLTTLERLLDALCALTVTTGTGPSGTPVNAAEFRQIKEDLKNYLTA